MALAEARRDRLADRARAQEVQLAIAAQRIVDDSNAPITWTLADRAGNRVCIAAWPDGACRGERLARCFAGAPLDRTAGLWRLGRSL